jgi:hypothetical protein
MNYRYSELQSAESLLDLNKNNLPITRSSQRLLSPLRQTSVPAAAVPAFTVTERTS